MAKILVYPEEVDRFQETEHEHGQIHKDLDGLLIALARLSLEHILVGEVKIVQDDDREIQLIPVAFDVRFERGLSYLDVL